MEHMTVRELTAHMSISPNEEWAISGGKREGSERRFFMVK